MAAASSAAIRQGPPRVETIIRPDQTKFFPKTEVDQNKRFLILFKEATALYERHFKNCWNLPERIRTYTEELRPKILTALENLHQVRADGTQIKQDAEQLVAGAIKQVAEVYVERQKAMRILDKIQIAYEVAIQQASEIYQLPNPASTQTLTLLQKMGVKLDGPNKQFNAIDDQIRAGTEVLKLIPNLREEINSGTYYPLKAVLQPLAYELHGFVTTEKYSSYRTVNRLRDAYIQDNEALSKQLKNIREPDPDNKE